MELLTAADWQKGLSGAPQGTIRGLPVLDSQGFGVEDCRCRCTRISVLRNR